MTSVYRAGFLLLFALCVCSRAVADQETSEPFGLKTRIPWTSSRIVGTPEPPPPYTVRRAFPELTFQNPLFVAEEPGTDRILVGELSGKIYAFDKHDARPESRQLFLDIGRELYAFSFHPRYEENGFIFVFSPKDPQTDASGQQSRVSRYTADLNHPRRCLPDTEQIIIEWPAGGHNGGEAIFGPDGYLYIATGDSTSGSDLKSTGQGVDDLLSVIMRIDVEKSASDQPYRIPEDNPFIGYPKARPEIWAFGFRNPWRMSFDEKTGGLWVGDVGQDLWEMIWLVERGGNYGWSVQEGTHPFHPGKSSGPGPILPPVVEHHHSICRSITGGYVYYGDKFPELQGVYFYGDYEYGKIWGVRHDGQRVTWHQELADTSLRIPSFGVSRDGDIYLMDHLSGELYELVEAPPEAANSNFPRRLSETGLFASVPGHQPAAGIIPYSVNVPQWADNASKERLLGLPGETRIKFVERSGNASTWDFEDGTVVAETLSLEMEAGNPDSSQRIETRILVKQQNHWLGYSYVWNDEQTDADLVDAAGLELKFDIREAAGDTRQQTWRIHSRNECMVCHSRAAGFVLGLRTVQMNKRHDYGGIVDNQLRTLNHIGAFTEPLARAPEEYDALTNPYDRSAALSPRARAYLHTNCSVCHVSDGGGNAKIELKYYDKLEDANLINEKPLHGTFGLAEAHLVTPGDPYASVLLYRLSKLGRGRMPHVGSNLIDERALDLIHDWIMQLPQEEQQQPSGTPVNHPHYVSVSTTLETLHTLPDQQREATVAELLSSTREAFILSRCLDDEVLPESVRQDVLRLATAHADTNVRDLFERFLPEQQRIKRLGDSIDTVEILSLAGSAERGRSLFFSNTASQCQNCHRIGGTGALLGPDLSDIGKRYKPHELLESLVAPSIKIDPKYITSAVVTASGQVLTGIVAETSASHVAVDVFQNGKAERLVVPRNEVEEIFPQKISLMPAGLMREFTAQEAADLVAFLVAQTEAPSEQPSP